MFYLLTLKKNFQKEALIIWVFLYCLAFSPQKNVRRKKKDLSSI